MIEIKDKNALIIVDMQNDFVEGGSLAVNGGKKLVKNFNGWFKENSRNFDLVIASRDWHLPNDSNGGHISDVPDYVDTWPAHCIQNTFGGEYAVGLDTSSIDVHITKGMGIPAYSAFDGKLMNRSTTLLEVLREHDITKLSIVGIATDYCVKKTALDSMFYGYETEVFLDLTAPIHDPVDVVKEFKETGIVTSFVLKEDKVWSSVLSEWV